MKWMILTALAGVAMWGAVLLGIRLGQGPEEAPPPAAVQAWQARLEAQGQQVTLSRFKIVPATLGDLYAARCDLSPSGRMLVLVAFDNVAHAQEHLAFLHRIPEEAASQAHGRWVLRLSGWPADDALTRAVLAEFEAFAASSAP